MKNMKNQNFTSAQFAKITAVSLSGLTIHIETEFGFFDITTDDEAKAKEAFADLDAVRKTGERVKIEY